MMDLNVVDCEANNHHEANLVKVQPACHFFGKCGGCCYQDINYEDELKIKLNQLQTLFSAHNFGNDIVIEPVVASPKPYHYRHRVDLKLKRFRKGNIELGFTPNDNKGLIEVDSCSIADQQLSNFIPTLKQLAAEKLPEKYRMANLTLRTGDDGRVVWGGIGRRSTRLKEEEYLFTMINDRKIFFSLDTFFQANLSILPKLFERIRGLDIWSDSTVFFDLYGGVGLFSIVLADLVKKVVLIEECAPSIKLAKFNVAYHKFEHFEVVEGRVEEHLEKLKTEIIDVHRVAMIDPPRAGLSDVSQQMFSNAPFNVILYLSCNPQTLVRDLMSFVKNGWQIQRVIPFDFFPKTKHLEVLTVLKKW